MVKTLIFTIVILGSAIAMLALKLLVKGDARGPMQHIGASKAMRDRGIGCVESMDARERFERTHKPHAKETSYNRH